MAVPGNALKKWEKVRAYALGLPGAAEEHPWGETVTKADKKVFVLLGAGDGGYPIGVTPKPTDETARAHAPAGPGAAPAGYGPGRSGRVGIPLGPEGAPAAGLRCDWGEEGYRTLAPMRLTAEPDAR
ncbi:MmcQ/YjbR family DNA-binding protein [Streptomyces sp. NPDC007904]|jgi:hypothetical protein|uniref:MmcQ/YjbR family DNA-binding protein n=1 Tax=Streptomyces sp. NPDC007904 TaxID=3364787 RepID=UPI0036E8245E